ncbi:hypothetical protein A2U01_0026474, partial [Trifolium medium]|nr:hypothetical protein [Trifolium medium]
MAFLRAFELVCQYLEIEPTVPIFFRVFKLQRQPSKDGRHGWVSLKQQVKLFKMFVDSVRHFKERFFIVRPLTELAIDSLFESKFVLNDDGSVRLDEGGVEMTRNPILDAKGNERVEKWLINTKELFGCKSTAEVKICLDNMSGFADRVLKLAADKKANKNKEKGRTTVLSQSGGPGSSSSPGG